MRLALEIVSKTLLNADVAEEARDVAHCLELLIEDFLYRWETLVQLPEWLPTARNKRRRYCRERLDEIVYSYIKQRRTSGEDRGDLLSMLLQVQDEDGSRMSDKQLRDEVMTLYLAGHETTANALSWTWYLLAQHPEVEAKLQLEVDAVLAGRPP